MKYKHLNTIKVNLAIKMATKWLTGIQQGSLDKGMIHVPGRTKQGSMQFKTDDLFISEIFHWVFLFLSTKSETVDKRGLVYDEHFWFLLYVVYDWWDTRFMFYSKKNLKSRKLYVIKNISFTKNRKGWIINSI